MVGAEVQKLKTLKLSTFNKLWFRLAQPPSELIGQASISNFLLPVSIFKKLPSIHPLPRQTRHKSWEVCFLAISCLLFTATAYCNQVLTHRPLEPETWNLKLPNLTFAFFRVLKTINSFRNGYFSLSW